MVAKIRLGGVILALALPVTAGATVYTSGYTDDTASGGYNYSGYNVQYPAVQSEQIGLYGAQSYQVFCGICTGGSTGTRTPGTGATTSADQAHRTLNGVYKATSSGHAALATAKLSVQTLGTSYNLNGYNYYVRSQGVAGFDDGLNFQVVGGSPTTDIGVTVDLRGGMVAGILGGPSLSEQLGFGSANIYENISSRNGSPPAIDSSGAAGWLSYNFSPLTPGHITFHGVYQFTGASQHINVSSFLMSYASSGHDSYTQSFLLQLPQGVSFTSDSGVFLSGAPHTARTESVPEPASFATIVAGAGLIGAAKRLRWAKTIA